MQLQRLKEVEVTLPEENLGGDGISAMTADFGDIVEPRLLGSPNDESPTPTAKAICDSVDRFVKSFAPKKNDALQELSERLGSRGRDRLESLDEETSGVSVMMRKNLGCITEIVGVLVQGRINAVQDGSNRRIGLEELTQIIETLLTSITLRDISEDFRQFVLEISPEFQVMVNIEAPRESRSRKETFGPVMSVEQITEELADMYSAIVNFVLTEEAA